MARKKDRFEVFKRDGFTCQYCGRTPPEVILELDHIIPKSKGGTDNIDNYITACFDCNRGKGGNNLSDKSPQVENRIETLREKQTQIKKYNRYLQDKERVITEYTIALDEILDGYFGKVFTESFHRITSRRFFVSLPNQKVYDALHIACSKMPDDSDNAVRYFCGICWNWIKRPDTRDW